MAALLVAAAGLKLQADRTPVLSDPEPIRAVMNNESRGAADRDLLLIQSLYAEDAVIHDVKNGRTWKGMDAIIDRYANLPRLTYLEHVYATIKVDPTGGFAEAESGTSVVGIDASGMEAPRTFTDNERWTFRKTNGAWKIVAFAY